VSLLCRQVARAPVVPEHRNEDGEVDDELTDRAERRKRQVER
jgi:hypothetical protein